MLKIKKHTFKNKVVATTVASGLAVTAGVAGVLTFIQTGQKYVARGAEDDSGQNVSMNTISEKIRKTDNEEHKDEEKANSEEQKPENKEEKQEKKEVKQSAETVVQAAVEESKAAVDQIITKEISEEEGIAFGIETRNEKNLPRGEVKVAEAGAEGLRRIDYRITYKNGELISKEEIGSFVVRDPVNQINLIGISDYNMNDSYIQLYPNASVSRDGASAPAFMILVNNSYYMDFWYDPVTWNRIAPSTAVLVSGGSFSYDGKSYGYNTGPLNSGYALSETFCARYGLACGRW